MPLLIVMLLQESQLVCIPYDSRENGQPEPDGT